MFRRLQSAALCILLTLPLLVAPGASGRADPGAEPTPPAGAARRPFLWRIERQPPAYLFGTIHLPDARVLDLPASVESAFEQADVLYTEVPMDWSSRLEAMKLSMYEGATTLKTVLPDDLYRRLSTFVDSKGIPFILLSRYKIWAVAASLPLLDQMSQAEGRQVLDLYLAERADAEQKQTDALETVASQVAVMESMGDQGQLSMLRQTLDYLERTQGTGQDVVEELILAYLSGDDERLLALADAQMDASNSLTPQVKEALLYARNRSMSETILKKLAERPDQSHFFAVGVLHYPGERGIVQLLRERGEKLSRVD